MAEEIELRLWHQEHEAYMAQHEALKQARQAKSAHRSIRQTTHHYHWWQRWLHLR